MFSHWGRYTIFRSAQGQVSFEDGKYFLSNIYFLPHEDFRSDIFTVAQCNEQVYPWPQLTGRTAMIVPIILSGGVGSRQNTVGTH
jgi:hypothetical protein